MPNADRVERLMGRSSASDITLVPADTSKRHSCRRPGIETIVQTDSCNRCSPGARGRISRIVKWTDTFLGWRQGGSPRRFAWAAPCPRSSRSSKPPSVAGLSSSNRSGPRRPYPRPCWRASRPSARQALRVLLDGGRAVFTPQEDGEAVEVLATRTLDRIFIGLAIPQTVVTPGVIPRVGTRRRRPSEGGVYRS
jgi:hypothetical protein